MPGCWRARRASWSSGGGSASARARRRAAGATSPRSWRRSTRRSSAPSIWTPATHGRATAAAAERLRQLRGTVPRALAAMTPAGRAPADLRLGHVTVLLGLRHRRTLDALVAAQQDRRSPLFHRWLDAAEIADRFGPRRDEYERVRRWFVAHGFEVVRDSQFRIALVVAGTAAQVEVALGAPAGRLVHGGRTYHAPLADPSLPESIAASVRGVVGLDDLPKFRPLAAFPGSQTALVPSDFAAAYGVAPLQAAGLTGAGHSIAVVARSNFADTDVALFSSNFLSFQLAPVRVFPGADPGILAEEGERIEVLLDTQWAGSLAPGATLDVVIGSPHGDIPEALIAAIENRAGDVVSLSFGLCEQAAPMVTAELFDAFYAVANSQGQTVLVASGDDGGRDCAPQSLVPAVSLLASSPHVVAVGGTSFALNLDGSVPGSLVERVWEDSGGAGGGGRSLRFGMPRYQIAAGLAGLSSGRARAGEWLVEQELFVLRRNHLPAPLQICHDGEAQCDADGTADGQCTLRVALCLNVFDSRGPLLHARGRRKGLPLCQPGTVRRARLLAPRASRRDPTAAANHQALAEAIGALPLPTALAAACTATVPVIVPVNGRVTLRALVADARGPVTPRVTLRCTP